MDRQYIQDNQLVDRYLQDKLSDDEKAAFEEYYLSNAETLAELEMAENMQAGFRQLDESDIIQETAGGSWFNRIFLSPQYAAAASVLLVFSLGLSGVLYQQRQTDPGFDRTRIIPVVSVRGTSSGQPANVVRFEPTDDWIVLLVDPGFETYIRYSASVARADGDDPVPIWRRDDLQPGYEDMLAVGLPGSLLDPGDYEITLSGQATADADDFAAIGRFGFTVSQP
jgi:hypothetical protein